MLDFDDRDWIVIENVKSMSVMEPKPYRSPRQIIREIAQRNGVTLDEILEKGRTYRVSYPRQEAMYELRLRGLSTTRIGQLMNRDHTTIIFGCRAHAKRSGKPCFIGVKS